MRPFRTVVCGLAALLLAAAGGAWGWTLEGPDASWEIDEETGAIASGSTADGFKAVGRCADLYEARLCRRHNDANVLCLGERNLDRDATTRILSTWLAEVAEGGRHARRVRKIDFPARD